jgi:chromosomal replication initiator protein
MEVLLPKTQFSTWFKDTKLGSIKDHVAKIIAPNSYCRDWLKDKYSKEILSAISKIEPSVKEISFAVRQTAFLEQIPMQIQPKIVEKPKPSSPSTPNSNLNQEYTFETLVVGNNNSLAYAVAKEVAENPGKLHNPLFIYGGVGLGKTHLAQAVGAEVKKNQKTAKVVYVSCETFTNDFIGAIATKKMSEFKKNYRDVDVLIVDDVQFLSSKEGSQEEFFHTFNSLQQKSRQIILTADKIPQAIPALEGRLASRFGGGMVVDVQPPNLETRMAILGEKCREKGSELPESVIEFIAKNISSNIRELEGALNRTLIHCQFNKLAPTPAIAAEVLKDMVSSQNRVVDSAEIISAVCKYFSIAREDLLGKNRKKELSCPRQIAIFLIREQTNKSLPEIGKIMGGKDHTTIMYADRKIQDLLQTDVSVKSDVEKIRAELQSFPS